MSQAMHPPTVVVEVTVVVPRGTDCGLGPAARNVLGAVEGVETVSEVRTEGFQPRATDIAVTVTARLVFDGRPDDVTDRLTDGFGVREATVTEARA